MVKPLSAVLLFTSLGAIDGIRAIKKTDLHEVPSGDSEGSLAESDSQRRWLFPPPSPGFGGLPGFPNPTPQCADLSGQYQSTFNNEMVTFTQPNGCEGTVSGGANFMYKVEQNPQGGMIVTVMSGPNFGGTGTVSNTAPRTIVWGDGTVYEQQGGPSPTPGFPGTPPSPGGFPGDPSCVDLTGQYSSDAGQTYFLAQNGCEGTVGGDASFTYTVEGNQVMDGNGNSGTFSSFEPRTITFAGGAVVWTQSGGGSNPPPYSGKGSI